MGNEFEEFNNLMLQLDIASFDMVDQLLIALEFAKMIDNIKPILLKYAAKDKNVSNFIMKL